ncbi:MAG: Uma2 family endonuclease [Bryobacteraceae bacterium]|nr:Uma2 family endonuclease [Bryobacteraceae bacterium]
MTAEEFDTLVANGADLELIHGEAIEIVSANYEHNKFLARTIEETGPQLRRSKWGDYIPETDFVFGEHRMRPDLALIRAENAALADRHRVPVRVIPDIAVEIASPTEGASDLDVKVAAYLDHGVLEVWVFFIHTRRVYVHSASGVRRLGPGGKLTTPVVPGLELDLDSLFADL